MVSKITAEQKNRILEKYVNSPGGRSIIASSLQQPLRTRRDYSSVIRKLYLVDVLPNGTLPVYEKDIDAKAYIVGEEGDSISVFIKGQRILFPLFELTALPEIPLTEITNRRFDVIERTVKKHTSQIGYEEDRKGLATIDAMLDDPTAPNADITVAGNMTSAALADAFACIEDGDLRVAYVLCNPKDFSDIRKWDRDTLDPVSQGELLKTGVRSQLWGANIIVSVAVQPGTVYVTAEPEFFGRIPVRYDLTVISADTPKTRTIGFSMFENIGIGNFNPKGAVRLKITR